MIQLQLVLLHILVCTCIPLLVSLDDIAGSLWSLEKDNISQVCSGFSKSYWILH